VFGLNQIAVWFLSVYHEIGGVGNVTCQQAQKNSPVARVALQKKTLLFDFAGCTNAVNSAENA
jgi:hypothetical protein